MTTARVLEVYLIGAGTARTRVGILSRDGSNNVTFVIDPSYIQLGDGRPILSASLWDPEDSEKTLARLQRGSHRVGIAGHLPPWFKNLLPEGALRKMVESQLPPGERCDFDVLAELGRDLPGAVEVVPDTAVHPTSPPAMPDGANGDANGAVKFSLAGMQLKFSMSADEERLTLPATDLSGNVIVKVAPKEFPELPYLELAAMKLAQAAGVRTAEVSLRHRRQVQGISEKHLEHAEDVLVVRRFDRTREGRVHIEDFAQVFEATPEQKYDKGNDETILKVVRRFSHQGANDALQALRRIVINLVLGNHDAHLKNWSFIYDTPTWPRLAPTYDIVPTVLLLPRDSRMALRFGGKRSPDSVNNQVLQRAAPFVGLEPRAMVRECRATLERASKTWPALIDDLPVTKSQVKKLAGRWVQLPLCDGIRNPFRG